MSPIPDPPFSRAGFTHPRLLDGRTHHPATPHGAGSRMPDVTHQLPLLTDVTPIASGSLSEGQQNEFTRKREKFMEFHRAHPEIYEALINESLALLRVQRRVEDNPRLRIQNIYSKVAGQYRIKMSNDHMPFYARLMMYQNEELRHRFKLNP